jgi:uncharacterized protein YcfL
MNAFARNSFIISGAMLLFAFITGCQADLSPGAGMGDFYPAPLNDPQISVLDQELRQWIVFQNAVVINDGERPMEVQVPVRNLAERAYLIDYRILFYDAAGREISPQMSWAMEDLLPKQVKRLTAKALDLEAVNYRLEVKWSK